MTQQLVLVLSQDSHLEEWIALAKRLISPGGTIHLRGLVTVAEGASLSEGTLAARGWRESLDAFAKLDDEIHDDVRVHVDYQPMARVVDEIPILDAELMLVQWGAPSSDLGGMTTSDVLKRARCDVALICRDGWWVTPTEDASVLLSLRGGTNLSLGVRVASAIANGGAITLFHATDNYRSTAPELERILRADKRIARTVTATAGLTQGVQREARYHTSVVMGASFSQLSIDSSSSSPVVDQIFDTIDLPLVLVRTYHPESVEFHAPDLVRAEEEIGTRVDRWFAENTFDSGEFSDLAALLALKEKQGVTISIALPALNEEKTVGTVITTLKTALMQDLPLVDEIVLIDSMSTDNTVEIAESLGVKVYKHPEILPEVGTYRGKGEALWKSLHVTKGDIVAWVDTDITNIHPRFIYGLIGPLLKRPAVQFVKGFYQRPIQVGGKMQAYGGGRVTELVARPLFNLFYPELSGIIQPLSGEYAGRRAALEQLPFFSGYGVETGMLIDILERFGLDAIAQTDLEMRVHHNQPLVGLSKMSFAILQVFIARLEARYGVQLLERANRSMKLIIQEPDVFGLEVEAIGDVERPPMLNIPTYARRYEETAQSG